MSREDESSVSPAGRIERRLAAILHADVQGYSRLIEHDEVSTLQILTPYLAMMAELVRRHGGRPIGSRGDSLLAEFPSVIEAVQCAVEMQHELKRRNATLLVGQRIEFRMGINLGEVVSEGEQLHGDGINIAVRLESLAEAGGILLSGTVYDQVEHKLPFHYEYLGKQTVKNITKPVRVYRVVLEGAGSPWSTVLSPQSKKGRQKPRRVGTSVLVSVFVLVLVLLFGGIAVVRYLSLPVSSPQSLTPNPQPLPLPDKPSIVVLPFVNLSGEPEQEYFSDGITEDLTSALSRLSGLFVISRNSAFFYKGKAVKLPDLSQELGVQYVLEGSIRKADNRIRITAQLIDATTDRSLWSERYDRELKDIFALQDEIVEKIVTTLRLQLSLQEQGYIVRKTTDNLEAYDYLLRGIEPFFRFTPETNAQARQLWEKAIALDPQYAEAYAWLSWTYWREAGFRWSTDPQTLEQALALAQRALALDDSLPRAHSVLGFVYALKQQYDQAIAEGERATALDPNSADTYTARAFVLNLAGRPEAALRMMEQAMRLNPRYPPIYSFQLGLAYNGTGRYAEAITTLKELISRDPSFMTAHLLLAASYWLQWVSQKSPAAQTLEPAMAAVQRALALSDSYYMNHTVLGYISLYQQQYDQALAEMEQAVALAPTEAGTYAGLAEVLSYMGRMEEALDAAAQAPRLKSNFADDHLAGVGTAYVMAGRYEEARAFFQRFLSRYPNRLDIHLMLAAVYSELGKEAEAQAEAAEVLRINPNFSLEVHRQRVPIKDPAMLERHIAALREAGLK